MIKKDFKKFHTARYLQHYKVHKKKKYLLHVSTIYQKNKKIIHMYSCLLSSQTLKNFIWVEYL